MRNTCATLALTVAAAACGPSPAPSAPAHPPAPPPGSPAVDAAATSLGRAIDAYVSGFGKNWGEAEAFSGYLAVARDGRVVFGKAYGKADRATALPADMDTLFRLGSLSKPFTAIGILQLEEKGLLRIDDPVRKYLPELPPMADAVTIHHCLTHTSGVPPLPDDEALVAETGKVHPVAAAFASYQTKTLAFPPGERFEYSNAGYTILGAIIERVTGESYEAYAQEHIFGPAGMTRSTTVSSPRPAALAVGYAVGGHDELSPAEPITYVTFGCGAVLSTPRDLIAWDRALAGNVILSAASQQRMLTPEKDVGALLSVPARYALGWFVSQEGGREVFSHAGGVNGFETDLARVPDAGVVVVVLSNIEGTFRVVRKVEEGARAITLVSSGRSLTGTSPPPVVEHLVGTFAEGELGALAGDYALDPASALELGPKLPPGALAAWAGLSLTAEGGHLFMRLSGRPTAAEVFRGTDGSLFTKHSGWELAPDPSGKDHPAALWLSLVSRNGVRAHYVRLTNALEPAPPGSCPAGMVRLPGGTFTLGRTDSRVSVEPFCMDLTEVTVGAYRTCVRSGACAPLPATASWVEATAEDRARWSPKCNVGRSDRTDHPLNCVDIDHAAAFCRAQGRRLPTEAEWEWAARGEEQARTYPWGFRPPDDQLCWRRDSTCPVGAFPGGDARGGIHDLAGNLFEWTATAAPGAGVVQKGGAFFGERAANHETTAHFEGEPKGRFPTVGFRCAR